MTTAYPKEKDMTSVMASKATRWLAVLVASALILALMVGGDQRSAQAIGPGETDIAYVADGYNFPDALMGATLATLNNAPMLGVRSPSTGDVVPPETAEELDRLTNDKANKLATIYVFGGPAAVSDKVAGDLEAWANNVQRIFGENRFSTMQAISEMLPTKAKDADLLDGMDSTELMSGAASSTFDSVSGVDTTVTNVGSVQISAPVAGKVIAQAHGNFITFGSETVAWLGIEASDSALDSDASSTATVGLLDGSDSTRRRWSVSPLRVFDVAAGTHTVYLNVQKSSTFGTNSVNLSETVLTLTFVPGS